MIEWPELKLPPINLISVWNMEPKDIAKTKNYQGFSHTSCEFYPCHPLENFKSPNEFNCIFCNCPLYWLECPGNYTVIEDADGVKRKDCSECKVPHDGYERSWKIMNLSKYQKEPEYWSKE